MPAAWEETVTSKRQALKNAIPAEWVIPPAILPPVEQVEVDLSTFITQSEFFSNSEVEILSSSAAQLLPRLATTNSPPSNAAVAQQLINPLTEIFFDEALATAKALDEHLKDSGKPIGPLHGLPISLKDNFHVKGKDSSLGFVSMVNKPAAFNSPITQLLLDAGAVLYVKTNVPPGMKRPETDNTVFGKTLNPKHRLWAVGGSSGGEGALISFGGSCLGVGSDLGGSCRIPAACAGIFTLRPSSGRWSISKSSTCTPGQDSFRAVPGPMARTLDDVILFSKAFAEQAPWKYDAECVPFPWRNIEPKARLKLAVVWDDGVVAPTPPVRRALEGAVNRLKNAGHDIVDFPLTGDEMQEAMRIAFGMVYADGGNWVRKVIDPTGEPMSTEMAIFGKGKPKTIFELHELHVLRDALRMKWLEKWNSIDGLDGILIPTSPYSVPEYGKFNYASYTFIFNILDYPATSFPSGYHADKELDKPYNDYTPLGEEDKKAQEEYNPDVCHGAPVSFQIVCPRLQEEQTLMVTEVVCRTLHGN